MRAIRTVLVIALVAAACPVGAQELSLLGGAMQDAAQHNRSYAWALDYHSPLGERAALGFTYLNEGHVPFHHRDGGAVQLWLRSFPLGSRLSLEAGIGPYAYFDTTRSSGDAPYHDDHGWGVIGSLGAVWHGNNRLFYQFRMNRVNTGGMDTLTALMGIGSLLGQPATPGRPARVQRQRRKTTENELTVFIGRTIVNSFGSEPSVAESIEYRRGISRHVDWTVSWLDEGDNSMILRNGAATQLWLTGSFSDERIDLGIGGGVYRAVDQHADARLEKGGGAFFSVIATMTVGYRVSLKWALRISWSRIITDYDRDSDAILGGVGYRF